MFFVIETYKRSRDPLSDWTEFERHPVLWTARNRVRMMLEEYPQYRGHIRIVGCTPLDAVNKEYL